MLATHTPSPPCPRPGRENVLQEGQGMWDCKAGLSSAPGGLSFYGIKEEIGFDSRCFCTGNKHRLEQY